MRYIVRYQLWIFYGVNGEWKLEGFFDTEDEAENKYAELRENIETPCIDDVEIIRVECKRP